MIDKNQAIKYAELFAPPAERYFFTKVQLDRLALDEKKLNATRDYVAILLNRPDLLPEYEKGVAEDKYYSSREAINVIEELQAMDGNGKRYDLRKSLISPTGQVVIMSEALTNNLDLISDDYFLQEDLPKLVSAMEKEGIVRGEIDKISKAAEQYGAIILQRGGYVALRSLLNEVVEVNNVKSSFESYQSKLVKPAPASEHGASLNALKGALEAAKLPQTPVSQKSPALTSAEIKREVGTKELMKPAAPMPEKPMPKPAPAPMPPPRPIPPQPIKPAPMPAPEPKREPSLTPRPSLSIPLNKVSKLGLADLKRIEVVDDLKKIEPAHLRQASLSDQIKLIREKISYLAKANHLLPIQVESVFEQSPLFSVYLQIGNAIMSSGAGQKPDYNQIVTELSRRGQEVLSLSEFESIADLRKDMEHM